MIINSIHGVNTQAGQMGINQMSDSYSRDIQNQIANAQKQLQELSSNEDMPPEEKIKKRQEIQKQINDLNIQLRQHQMELRREKQQAKNSSTEDMIGGTEDAESAKAGNKSTGLSQTSMTAMISADSSVKQAKVLGNVATKMEGEASVLGVEIELSKLRGENVENKQEAKAQLEKKAQSAKALQLSALADASKTIEKAAKEEQTTKEKEDKDYKTKETEQKEEKTEENVFETDEESEQKNISTREEKEKQQKNVRYASVDIRL